MDLMEESMLKNREALSRIAEKIQPRWITCPQCKLQFNKLNAYGICLDCEVLCSGC